MMPHIYIYILYTYRRRRIHNICMYVCMYTDFVYSYICMYVCLYTDFFVQNICMYACTPTFLCHLFVCTYACTFFSSYMIYVYKVVPHS